jgi:hypothetical protein
MAELNGKERRNERRGKKREREREREREEEEAGTVCAVAQQTSRPRRRWLRKEGTEAALLRRNGSERKYADAAKGETSFQGGGGG